MAIFDGQQLEILFVEQIDSLNEVPMRARIGAPVKPHCTAIGKTISAFLDADTARRVLKKNGMRKWTAHTITDAAELEREFATIQAQGYAVDREEAVENACCLAAPVFDHTGAVVAAISVSMMATRFYRWAEPELAGIVKSFAAKLSATLGCDHQAGALAQSGLIPSVLRIGPDSWCCRFPTSIAPRSLCSLPASGRSLTPASLPGFSRY